MKVWSIKHKPTGKFMPARMFRTSYKGFSYWNPHESRDGYKPHDENPRIFFTLQSARNALTMWLAGEWRVGKQQEGDWETGYYMVDGDPEPSTPPVERKREDMEIVELELTGGGL